MKRVLVLGVNGFIGHHLSRRILQTTDWEIVGMDTDDHRLETELSHPRFAFHAGDIRTQQAWIEAQVARADVVLPLVAIATPSVYVTDPLGVFELDFEANLPIVRAVAKHGKHLVFPSTSEVYGMSGDTEFDADTSPLVYGPIGKTRWIYACAKQMMDRVIHAHGQQRGLRYTLFRPFNWIGPGLDSVQATKEGSSRVVTQFLGQILRGEALRLVSGGAQRRCFTDVTDGIDALMQILHNERDIAIGRIYNIGNPGNDLSIRELAELMLELARAMPGFAAAANRVVLQDVAPEVFYGPGYEDATRRVPNIEPARRDLGWSPRVSVRESLRRIFEAYRQDAAAAGALLGPQTPAAQG